MHRVLIVVLKCRKEVSWICNKHCCYTMRDFKKCKRVEELQNLKTIHEHSSLRNSQTRTPITAPLSGKVLTLTIASLISFQQNNFN